MKKSLKWLVGIALGCSVTLGLATTNNLGIQFFSLGEPETIAPEEIVKTVKNDLFDPLEKILFAKDSFRNMTKCYSRYYFTVQGVESEKLAESDMTFYKGQVIYGKIIHNQCGNLEDVCSYQYHLETKEVLIKESYFTEWVKLEQFIQRVNSMETKME